MRAPICLLLSFLLLLSCTTSTVTPTRKSRQIIDSIYQRKIVLLQPGMDSFCISMQDTVFHHAVDSIMSSRQLEMDSLVR
jgi:hypothetical protein